MTGEFTLEEAKAIHDEKAFKFTAGTYGYKNQYGAGGCAVGALLYGRLGLVGGSLNTEKFPQLLGLSEDYILGLDDGFEHTVSSMMIDGAKDFEDVLDSLDKDGIDIDGYNLEAYKTGAEIALAFRNEVLRDRG